MERSVLVIFLVVGYVSSYEWHFGNDNPNYVYIEYLEGNIWPLGKSTKVTISVPPCMMVKYVWVAVVNLFSNPTVTYNKDTYTVMIQYGLLSSSTSGYHVVAKGMRDPACGGGGTGGGDPHCPPPVCPPPSCPIPNCPPPNCMLPNDIPRCPPPQCPPLHCPPPICPPVNCPRPQCPPVYCPLPTCPPPQCYYPYVPAPCPQPYCPGCPQKQCGPPQNRQMLSGKKLKKPGAVKPPAGRQRDQTMVLDYNDGNKNYNTTGTLNKRFKLIDSNGNIFDPDAYDFEDDDYLDDETDSDESNKSTAEKMGEGGEKHNLMLFIVSDKKGGKHVEGERNEGKARDKGYNIGSRPGQKIIYSKNSRYHKVSGDGGGNSVEAGRGIGYVKGVGYGWGNENSKNSMYSGRHRVENTITIDYGRIREHGRGNKDNSDSNRDWGYGYDANVFYPENGSRSRTENDRGSNNALCSSYYDAKSGYGGNRGNGKGSTYTGNLCADDENAIDDGFVAMDRGSGHDMVDGQLLDDGDGSAGQFLQ